jgi:hypothetical protein
VFGKASYGTSDVSNQITWTCTDNPNDSTVSGTAEAPWGTRGAVCDFIPVPPPAQTGRTAPLSYIIKAKITMGDKTREHSVTVTQDKLDELRQEYEDLWRVSQTRSNFDQDPAAFPGLLGVAAESSKHNNWHILRRLNQHALESNSEYVERYGGGDIRFSIYFTSGYRCPIGNLYTLGAELDSNHQYGKAFDFDQGANTQANSLKNYYVYRAAHYYAGARADTYLKASDGTRYRWDRNPPPPPALLLPGVVYVQGHAAWDN